MSLHKNLTGDAAIHQAAFIQASDPGAVGAWKIWIDITDPADPVFNYRNSGDTAWVVFNPAVGAHTHAQADVTGLVSDLADKVEIGGDLGGTPSAPAVAAGAISDAKLRDSVGTSVIGRAAGTTGDVADIVATADGQILARKAGSLLFTPLSPGGGALEFPDALPVAPSAYDEEGDQAALAGKWTTVATPDASFVLETDRDGTFLGMEGPGHATNVWHLRQAIDNADGDHPNALTVTAKFGLTSYTGTPTILLQLSDNAAISTGNYIHFALVGGNATGGTVGVNNNGAVTSLALDAMTREVYCHYQRSAAGVVNIYFSQNGRAWFRFFSNSKTTNVDYMHLYLIGGAATNATALWVNFVRVNDARFLQPV